MSVVGCVVASCSESGRLCGGVEWLVWLAVW